MLLNELLLQAMGTMASRSRTVLRLILAMTILESDAKQDSMPRATVATSCLFIVQAKVIVYSLHTTANKTG